jgi:hypothetical protein
MSNVFNDLSVGGVSLYKQENNQTSMINLYTKEEAENTLRYLERHAMEVGGFKPGFKVVNVGGNNENVSLIRKTIPGAINSAQSSKHNYAVSLIPTGTGDLINGSNENQIDTIKGVLFAGGNDGKIQLLKTDISFVPFSQEGSERKVYKPKWSLGSSLGIVFPGEDFQGPMIEMQGGSHRVLSQIVDYAGSNIQVLGQAGISKIIASADKVAREAFYGGEYDDSNINMMKGFTRENSQTKSSRHFENFFNSQMIMPTSGIHNKSIRSVYGNTLYGNIEMLDPYLTHYDGDKNVSIMTKKKKLINPIYISRDQNKKTIEADKPFEKLYRETIGKYEGDETEVSALTNYFEQGFKRGLFQYTGVDFQQGSQKVEDLFVVDYKGTRRSINKSVLKHNGLDNKRQFVAELGGFYDAEFRQMVGEDNLESIFGRLNNLMTTDNNNGSRTKKTDGIIAEVEKSLLDVVGFDSYDALYKAKEAGELTKAGKSYFERIQTLKAATPYIHSRVDDGLSFFTQGRIGKQSTNTLGKLLNLHQAALNPFFYFNKLGQRGSQSGDIHSKAIVHTGGEDVNFYNVMNDWSSNIKEMQYKKQQYSIEQQEAIERFSRKSLGETEMPGAWMQQRRFMLYTATDYAWQDSDSFSSLAAMENLSMHNHKNLSLPISSIQTDVLGDLEERFGKKKVMQFLSGKVNADTVTGEGKEMLDALLSKVMNIEAFVKYQKVTSAGGIKGQLSAVGESLKAINSVNENRPAYIQAVEETMEKYQAFLSNNFIASDSNSNALIFDSDSVMPGVFGSISGGDYVTIDNVQIENGVIKFGAKALMDTGLGSKNEVGNIKATVGHLAHLWDFDGRMVDIITNDKTFHKNRQFQGELLSRSLFTMYSHAATYGGVGGVEKLNEHLRASTKTSFKGRKTDILEMLNVEFSYDANKNTIKFVDKNMQEGLRILEGGEYTATSNPYAAILKAVNAHTEKIFGARSTPEIGKLMGETVLGPLLDSYESFVEKELPQYSHEMMIRSSGGVLSKSYGKTLPDGTKEFGMAAVERVDQSYLFLAPLHGMADTKARKIGDAIKIGRLSMMTLSEQGMGELAHTFQGIINKNSKEDYEQYSAYLGGKATPRGSAAYKEVFKTTIDLAKEEADFYNPGNRMEEYLDESVIGRHLEYNSTKNKLEKRAAISLEGFGEDIRGQFKNLLGDRKNGIEGNFLELNKKMANAGLAFFVNESHKYISGVSKAVNDGVLEKSDFMSAEYRSRLERKMKKIVMDIAKDAPQSKFTGRIGYSKDERALSYVGGEKTQLENFTISLRETIKKLEKDSSYLGFKKSELAYGKQYLKDLEKLTSDANIKKVYGKSKAVEKIGDQMRYGLFAEMMGRDLLHSDTVEAIFGYDNFDEDQIDHALKALKSESFRGSHGFSREQLRSITGGLDALGMNDGATTIMKALEPLFNGQGGNISEIIDFATTGQLPILIKSLASDEAGNMVFNSSVHHAEKLIKSHFAIGELKTAKKYLDESEVLKPLPGNFSKMADYKPTGKTVQRLLESTSKNVSYRHPDQQLLDTFAFGSKDAKKIAFLEDMRTVNNFMKTKKGDIGSGIVDVDHKILNHLDDSVKYTILKDSGMKIQDTIFEYMHTSGNEIDVNVSKTISNVISKMEGSQDDLSGLKNFASSLDESLSKALSGGNDLVENFNQIAKIRNFVKGNKGFEEEYTAVDRYYQAYKKEINQALGDASLVDAKAMSAAISTTYAFTRKDTDKNLSLSYAKDLSRRAKESGKTINEVFEEDIVNMSKAAGEIKSGNKVLITNSQIRSTKQNLARKIDFEEGELAKNIVGRLAHDSELLGKSGLISDLSSTSLKASASFSPREGSAITTHAVNEIAKFYDEVTGAVKYGAEYNSFMKTAKLIYGDDNAKYITKMIHNNRNMKFIKDKMEDFSNIVVGTQEEYDKLGLSKFFGRRQTMTGMISRNPHQYQGSFKGVRYVKLTEENVNESFLQYAIGSENKMNTKETLAFIGKNTFLGANGDYDGDRAQAIFLDVLDFGEGKMALIKRSKKQLEIQSILSDLYEDDVEFNLKNIKDLENKNTYKRLENLINDVYTRRGSLRLSNQAVYDKIEDRHHALKAERRRIKIEEGSELKKHKKILSLKEGFVNGTVSQTELARELLNLDKQQYANMVYKNMDAQDVKEFSDFLRTNGKTELADKIANFATDKVSTKDFLAAIDTLTTADDKSFNNMNLNKSMYRENTGILKTGLVHDALSQYRETMSFLANKKDTNKMFEQFDLNVKKQLKHLDYNDADKYTDYEFDNLSKRLKKQVKGFSEGASKINPFNIFGLDIEALAISSKNNGGVSETEILDVYKKIRNKSFASFDTYQTGGAIDLAKKLRGGDERKIKAAFGSRLTINEIVDQLVKANTYDDEGQELVESAKSFFSMTILGKNLDSDNYKKLMDTNLLEDGLKIGDDLLDPSRILNMIANFNAAVAAGTIDRVSSVASGTKKQLNGNNEDYKGISDVLSNLRKTWEGFEDSEGKMGTRQTTTGRFKLLQKLKTTIADRNKEKVLKQLGELQADVDQKSNITAVDSAAEDLSKAIRDATPRADQIADIDELSTLSGRVQGSLFETTMSPLNLDIIEESFDDVERFNPNQMSFESPTPTQLSIDGVDEVVVKPKRKYTKRAKVEEVQPDVPAKPKRKYTKKAKIEAESTGAIQQSLFDQTPNVNQTEAIFSQSPSMAAIEDEVLNTIDDHAGASVENEILHGADSHSASEMEIKSDHIQEEVKNAKKAMQEEFPDAYHNAPSMDDYDPYYNDSQYDHYDQSQQSGAIDEMQVRLDQKTAEMESLREEYQKRIAELEEKLSSGAEPEMAGNNKTVYNELEEELDEFKKLYNSSREEFDALKSQYAKSMDDIENIKNKEEILRNARRKITIGGVDSSDTEGFLAGAKKALDSNQKKVGIGLAAVILGGAFRLFQKSRPVVDVTLNEQQYEDSPGTLYRDLGSDYEINTNVRGIKG